MMHGNESAPGRTALRANYDPDAHGVGIVHIGPGAFFRAHFAVYTDCALARDGGDWRIAVASLRSTEAVDALVAQDGRFTVIERGADGSRAVVVRSIAEAIAAAREPQVLMDRMVAPGTKVVSLTITEKGYGIDREAGGADVTHPAIAADLAAPRSPKGALGLIVEALRRRFASNLPPFTVLCCDNLPENGHLLRMGVVDFARRVDPELSRRIESEVSFPSTMVDRITPASTETTYADAERLTGRPDRAAVETEPFSQWVIEDRFPLGRPGWEAGGALFVDDVRPYEEMKLRMLNGSHSLLAYAGFHAGHEFVRDAMRDPAMLTLVRRHLDAAAATLPPVPAVDLESYAAELVDRFANPAIAHRLEQIAMDGTQKLPQRIFAPAVALVGGKETGSFAFVTAAWMYHARQAGGAGTLDDPRAAEITAALSGRETADAISEALHALPQFVPLRLREDLQWRRAVALRLAAMLEKGMPQAARDEVATADSA